MVVVLNASILPESYVSIKMILLARKVIVEEGDFQVSKRHI
jgi:hypothetical protein